MCFFKLLYKFFLGNHTITNPSLIDFCVAVGKLGNMGLVLVLFETPSGFAIFNIDGVQLFLPKAEEVLSFIFFLPSVT
jgi:hypothetical protein